MSTVFIVDEYDKYNSEDRNTARFIFKHNERWWAIKEYEVQNCQLMRTPKWEEPEDQNDIFYWYPNYESARKFVQMVIGR